MTLKYPRPPWLDKWIIDPVELGIQWRLELGHYIETVEDELSDLQDALEEGFDVV
jgi:hypothetical protein